MTRRIVVAGTWVVLVVGSVALAPGARAACHAFEAEVTPANPTEGATVEVTVTRDAPVNPSSVRVRTVDGTASAGDDYEPVDRRIEFTAEVEQTFTIRTMQDPADEPEETFRIELSQGAGCQVNPNFAYQSGTVTIQDDDPPPASAPAPPPATTAASATPAAPTTIDAVTGTTATTAASAAPNGPASSTTAPGGTTASTRATRTTLESEAALEVGDDDGVPVGWAILAAVMVVAAAAASYRLLGSRHGS